MLDDLRRLGGSIEGLVGSNIFGGDFPISYTDQFLAKMKNWEFAIPMKFLWLVTIDRIPSVVGTDAMKMKEPVGPVQHAAGATAGGLGWDINMGRSEIDKDEYLGHGGSQVQGCLFAQGVVLPGETYQVRDVPINNNMGFLPGKIGGNRSGMVPLQIQFRETNRSFGDLIIRPWIILTSHQGLLADDALAHMGKSIKCNIRVVQLAKTYQYTPLVERKIFNFYNCVPTTINTAELTYDANAIHMHTTSWHYTHYDVESLPHPNMSAYMQQQGFKRMVMGFANKLLMKSRKYRKLKRKVAKVTGIINKAAGIKNKIMGVSRGFQNMGAGHGQAPGGVNTRKYTPTASNKTLMYKRGEHAKVAARSNLLEEIANTKYT